MEIHNLPQYQIQNNNKKDYNNINFKGFSDAASVALRFLDTNQAWGANGVDLCSMVIPRTTVDMVNRGPAAGAETARRESSGTANHSLVGVYGTMAGLLFSIGLNKAFGIKAHKVFADNETFDIIGNAYYKYLHDGKTKDPIEATLREVFTNVKTDIDGKPKSLNPNQVNEIVDRFKVALNSKDVDGVTIPKPTRDYIVRYISEATGTETDYVLRGYHKETVNSLSNFVENTFNVAKMLTSGKDKVLESFKNAAKFEDVDFIKSLKHYNNRRTILGMAIGSAIGMAVQPLNIYLTKKKTGSDGFVGVEGREKDNSAGFMGWKAAASAVFGGGIIANLASQKGGLLKNVQFKGLVPTLNQFKLIYGMTIISRFMAARDKDELRESVVKDVLGFFNWLILGNFVAKGVAMALDKDKSLIKNPSVKSFFKKQLKTRDEVLVEGLKSFNLSTVKDGKALSFSDMLKMIPANEAGKAINRRLRILNVAQAAGYIYSGVVLGVGIPKLNIYMTNKSEAKRKAKLAAQKEQQALAQQNNASKIDIKAQAIPTQLQATGMKNFLGN